MSKKTIVITGASEGIGALTAKLLVQQGHRVVLAARREAQLKETAASIGGETLCVVADVTRRADMEHLRDEAIKRFGSIDVWVNNAGRGITRQALELTDADVDDMVAINIKSVLYGAQAVVPHFQKRGTGHILNVSSFLGRVPMASVRSIYSACKAAVNSLTANLRNDLRATHPGIHVTLVIPGLVATKFWANTLHAPKNQIIPPGMVAQPAEEVAAVIAGAIENPVPEVYTNPAQAAIAAKYYTDVAAFEAEAARR